MSQEASKKEVKSFPRKATGSTGTDWQCANIAPYITTIQIVHLLRNTAWDRPKDRFGERRQYSYAARGYSVYLPSNL
jgi:hypothetical protein